MTYVVTTKPSCMMDLFQVDAATQKQIPEMHERLAEFAETPMGNTIKKLKGFKSLWRYRIGDYRIIYAVQGDCSTTASCRCKARYI